MTTQAARHVDPTMFTLRDLERCILKSRKLAAVCQLRQDAEQAELHIKWMDILLDEWARRNRKIAA